MSEYIDRECLLHRFNIDDMMNVNGTLISLNDARNVISNVPAADVAPVRHGKWIVVSEAYGKYKCSVCEMWDSNCDDYYSSHSVLDQEYCPYCGARMDLEAGG